MDDPRDLTLADLAALRDLDKEGDGDVLARLYDDTVNVRSVLPEVPADWTPGEAGEVIQVFIGCFLDRIDRRSSMWRRLVEAELVGAVNDYLNIIGDPPDPSIQIAALLSTVRPGHRPAFGQLKLHWPGDSGVSW